MQVTRLKTILLVSFLFSATASAQVLDSAPNGRDQKGSVESIQEDDEGGDKDRLMRKHLMRASQLVKGKTTAEEFKAVIGQAEKHLEMAIAADPESLFVKSQLARLYMNYANLLEEQSPERLEYLIKADKTFREITENDTNSQGNASVQITLLSPAVLVRKQLAALDPETYSIDTVVERVRTIVAGYLQQANRDKRQDLRLWLILMNSASEIGQFDLAVDIADQGLKVVKSPEDRAKLAKGKSFMLRKAALTINNFDDFESYNDRFTHLCEATRAAPTESSNYLLLLQYVGKENPKPTIGLARQLGLATPGDAVPVKPEWLYRIGLEAEYTGIVNALIGFEEFHLGNNEAAIKSWSVAQRFDLSTREFIAKTLETMLLAKQDKLDHLETILSEALVVYPEAVRIQMLRGLYYTKEKKYQAAIDDFRIVLNRKPNEVLLHQRIKSCYQSLGQPQAAAAEQKIIDAKIQRMPAESRVQALEKLQAMEGRQAGTP